MSQRDAKDNSSQCFAQIDEVKLLSLPHRKDYPTALMHYI